MFVIGIDIGSTTIKTILIDKGKNIIAKDVCDSLPDSRKNARSSLERVISSVDSDRKEIRRIIATGYGRIYLEEADREVSEITCHARGIFHEFGEECTVIDIGGQDSKTIRINGKGRVVQFAMNDKCAAGTGRFLEVMSSALKIPLENMVEEMNKATQKVVISNTCTVFAESEVIGLVARGIPRADIIDAIHRAVASRIYPLVKRVGIADRVILTGGVARNHGIKKSLELLLEKSILIPESPQFSGALGAALIALQDFNTS